MTRQDSPPVTGACMPLSCEHVAAALLPTSINSLILGFFKPITMESFSLCSPVGPCLPESEHLVVFQISPHHTCLPAPPCKAPPVNSWWPILMLGILQPVFTFQMSHNPEWTIPIHSSRVRLSLGLPQDSKCYSKILFHFCFRVPWTKYHRLNACNNRSYCLMVLRLGTWSLKSRCQQCPFLPRAVSSNMLSLTLRIHSVISLGRHAVDPLCACLCHSYSKASLN